MTVLNGLLAFGALAFTIPLAIHLLFRSRFRTVDWGAMHLLDNVVRVNRRRIELMNLLLLLLRCLLPILLAFCLARPVLTGFQSLPGDEPRTLVIAIDQSRSMAARDVDGRPRIDRVKEQVTTLLSKLTRRDEVILLRSGAIDRVAGSMGATDAIRAVKDIAADAGPVDLARLVRASMDASDNATHSQRQILVASDFQSHMIGDAALESLERLKPILSDQTLRPTISFLNVGSDSSQLANVSVESIESDSPAVVASRSTKFFARIRNSGDTPIRDLRLVWSVSGKALPPRTITLAPRSSVTAPLSHKIDEVGVHPVSVTVEHGDALPEDNQRTIGVDVIREIKVLLVDGDRSDRPLESETDFLAIALSPFAFGGQDQPDAVRTSVIDQGRLVDEVSKMSPDIVVLANVAELNDAARTGVAQFVSEGGSLVVFDGDKVKPETYNQPFVSGDHTWSLPARLGEAIGGNPSPDGQSERFPIGQINGQFSAWAMISGDAKSGTSPFSDVDVSGYRKLQVSNEQPSESTSEAAIELLTLTGGDPLVVWAKRGKGHVVQFAIPSDSAWSNLPLRLVYLPMMQQLVLDLAGSQKVTTVDVGMPLSVAVTELTALIPDDAKIDPNQSPTYTMDQSDGKEVTVVANNDAPSILTLGNAESAGVYRIWQKTPTTEGKSVTTRTIRVADVPLIESQLRDADESRLARAAEIVSAEVYSDIDALSSDDRTRRFGREIWRWLLVTLLIAMVGEVLLQQRSLRRSPANTLATDAVGGAS